MQFGYPPAIIKTEDKENYYAVLRLADADELQPFIEYITENLIRSLEIMIKGAKGESIEEADDLDKELALLERQLKNYGNKVEIIKDQNVLSEIITSFVKPLVNEFLVYCSKYDKFYIKNELHFTQDSSRFLSSKVKPFHSLSISHNLSEIEYDYKFKTFAFYNFGELNFSLHLSIKFNHTTYSILGNRATKPILEKPYTEILTEDEIKNVVKEITDRHKVFIEEQIEKHQKLNN
jgi:hypothetical protein